MRLNSDQRLVTVSALCSGLVVVAGFFALWGEIGVQIASMLLTVAAAVGIAGFPYAHDRQLGWGIVALIAAVLPTFGALYAIGLTIFRHLGAEIAGGLLIGAGTVLMCVTAWYSLKLRSAHSAPR
jgi:hypothetical protein